MNTIFGSTFWLINFELKNEFERNDGYVRRTRIFVVAAGVMFLVELTCVIVIK